MVDLALAAPVAPQARWLAAAKRGGARLWLGVVLVERIFSYEGIGNMAIDAVINRDFPLIQGLVLTFAVLFIALNLVVDLAVALLDPRLRHG